MNKINVGEIKISGLSKTFRSFYDRPSSLKRYLVDVTKGNFSFGKSSFETVLDNISFTISPGEFVGIMGGNGAGKSTLLKLISGIYVPSKGQILVQGKIAPLIELGAGFHPELTGLENIFLNGAILGFGQKEIILALPEITQFSELGDKLCMPVKHYSSGMLARLGFSVATHLPAPILLIDEILAVGDEAFQKKCVAKINSLHSSGRTLILISHDSKAVAENCSRCIVLSKTGVVFDGHAKEGVEVYKKLLSL